MPTRRPLLATAALFVFGIGLLGFSPLLIHSPQAQDQTVPLDLAPLLAAPQSEMRMVVQRYNLDRTTLSGNYANGGGRGGGRGGRGRARTTAGAAPAPPPLVPLSPARIARLKRFDTNWQAALVTPRHREAHARRPRPISTASSRRSRPTSRGSTPRR